MSNNQPLFYRVHNFHTVIDLKFIQCFSIKEEGGVYKLAIIFKNGHIKYIPHSRDELIKIFDDLITVMKINGLMALNPTPSKIKEN